jgi:hypothetical protein
MQSIGAECAQFPMCAFETPYQKWTKVEGTLPGIQRLSRTCTCQFSHEQLCGLAKMPQPNGKSVSIWKTSLAGVYPPLLCRTVCALAQSSAPRAAWLPSHEAPLLPCWTREIAEATGKECVGLVPARCPATWRLPWADAVGFSMEGPSRLRREHELARAQAAAARAAKASC